MKIAINCDFGGFGYGVADEYEDFVNQLEGERDNPDLIAFVENHPDECGDLCVVVIPDDTTDWEIDECDGKESVIYVVNGKIYHKNWFTPEATGMMTIETITAQLDRISADSWYDVNYKSIDLTINDFEGFDEDWDEVFREFVNEDAIEETLKWLEENADCVERDLYHRYHFGEIVVEVGYTSFEI